MNLTEPSNEELHAWNHAWSETPETVEELWKVIGQLAFLLGSESRFVWRGMSSTDHLITSTLYRALQTHGIDPTEANHRHNEARMLQNARDWGLGHTQYGQSTDLQLLAELQHHGFPTRLIDVTVNPLTALWFACEQNPDIPGRLVAISVPNIAEVETSPTVVTPPTWGDMENPLGAKYLHQLSRSQGQKVPFLVRPTVRDARMNAQEGLFIASSVPTHDEGTPFPSLPAPQGGQLLLSLRKLMDELGFKEYGTGWKQYGVLGLEISSEMKKKLLPVLEKSFNRSAKTIYPDMEGFVRSKRDLIEENLEENTSS